MRVPCSVVVCGAVSPCHLLGQIRELRDCKDHYDGFALRIARLLGRSLDPQLLNSPAKLAPELEDLVSLCVTKTAPSMSRGGVLCGYFRPAREFCLGGAAGRTPRCAQGLHRRLRTAPI